jgi:hypothetical protein
MATPRRITAIQVAVETSTFTEDGRLSMRFKPIEVVAFEADIPDAVLEWVLGKLPKEGVA